MQGDHLDLPSQLCDGVPATVVAGEIESDGGNIVSPDVRPEAGAASGAGASETMIAGS